MKVIGPAGQEELKIVQETVESSTKAGTFATEAVRNAARGLNMLACLAIPQVIEFLFPPLYMYWWSRCTTLVQGVKGYPKFALGIPRGFAKTTFVKLFVLFIIVFTKRKFILVVGSNEDKANAIISDVIGMLSHPNIVKLFGDWGREVKYDNVKAKRFYFNGREIILKGVSVGTEIRGIAENYSRPDVMIFDDAQSKECAESVTRALAYQSWFYGTAMKCKDPKFCFFLYIGNMYKKIELPSKPDTPKLFACLLKNLKNSPLWESVIAGAINHKGESIWEELQGIEQLLEEYQGDKEAGQEIVFLSEVMNDDEATDSGMFDESKIKPYPFTDNSWAAGKVLVIDPSLGKTTSDQQIVGLVEVIEGLTVVSELKNFQVSAPDLVSSVLDWCVEDGITAIAIESYAYQASLGQWFEYFIAELGLDGIEILLVNRGQQSKNYSILNMFKEVMTGTLIIHPRALGEFLSEVKGWDQLKTNNVDNRLDVCAYANRVVLNFPEQIKSKIFKSDDERLRKYDRVHDRGMAY